MSGEQNVQPVMAPLVDARANLRRAVIIASAIAVVGIVLSALAGHPWAGVLGAVGLALGALNNRMLQRSVVRYGSDDSISRKTFRRGVLSRLAAVTLLAVGCAVLVRPDGLAVFVGLALFHVIMLIGAALPVFRSLRPTS
jgi:Na+/glutamate symporter